MMVADIVADSAAQTAETIGQAGGRAASAAVDVPTRKRRGAPVKSAIGELDGLDVVVNNAGITIVGAAHELPEVSGTGASRST